ncbi:MAG: geranylgeranyl reductase family protein [Methanobrevibacter sp.]|jgi:geranylgeranyl reductase family protein|nr:geranylgeranyl reductase family protein [Methanobrevibacter sp.]
MSVDYDVAIIGAGPIGSTLAYKLSQFGVNVAIFEKKNEIGVPLQCAGIVSKKIKELNDLPEDFILNEVKGAYLHSREYDLKVQKDETEAFIIDRIAYDQYLAKKAIESGAKLFKQFKAIAIDSKKGIIKFQNKDEIKAKIIVGADGSKSFVSDLFNDEFDYFNASQYLIETQNPEKVSKRDFVDVFAISKILPGFIWCIPSSKNSYRIGLFSNNTYKEQKEILNEFLINNKRFKKCNVIEKYHGKIPIFNKKKKIVKDRILLIGDAASQLKPTTGGGLIIGFDTVEIAKKSIITSLESNNVGKLSDYEKKFKKKYSKELSYQIKVQQTLKILSDNDLDYMFEKLKEKDGEKLISKYGDMDKQSVLVKEFIKRGLIFSIIPKMFFKKLIAIWNLNKN